MVKAHAELHDRQKYMLKNIIKFNYMLFFLNSHDNTDYVLIQNTFKENV